MDEDLTTARRAHGCGQPGGIAVAEKEMADGAGKSGASALKRLATILGLHINGKITAPEQRIAKTVQPYETAYNTHLLPGFAIFVFGLAVCSAGGALAQHYTPPYSAAEPDVRQVTFDQLYYAQIHNTYMHSKRLENWLDVGYRSVELDVIDTGKWENEENGPYVAHGKDPETANCTGSGPTRLGDCLRDIVGWEAKNQSAAPIVVLIDMKASSNAPSAWKGDEVAELDRWVAKFLGPAMYKYTDLRTHVGGGVGSDMRSLVKEKGWPKNAALQGKIVVGLTGGMLGYVNANMNTAIHYLEYKPATFMCPDVLANAPHQISGKLNDISEADSKSFVCANVNAGDRLETVLDESYHYKQMIHVWGHSGDFSNTDYAYNYMAVAHGGSILGWDTEIDQHSSATFVPDWSASIPLVGLRRGFPGYFEMENRESKQCVDVKDQNYVDGDPVLDWVCKGSDNQRFVYTAEGQLRPKGNNKFCIDIQGGKPLPAKKVHIWDCDGGSSEKWNIKADGTFRQGNQCLDLERNTKNGEYIVYDCDGTKRNQTFILKKVSDWTPSDYIESR